MTEDKEEMQEVKLDPEAFGRRIAQLMGDAIDGWRTCSVRACRRAHACSSDSFACIKKMRRERTRVLTPQEQSQSMHELRLMLDARRAELREQERQGEAAKEAMPWRKNKRGR